MNILGIGFLSDASAAVLRDGRLVSAVSEERLNRVKTWNGVPERSIREALRLAGLTLDEIDLIATHGAAPAEPEMEPFDEKDQAIRSARLAAERKDAQILSLRSRLEHERLVLGSRTPAYLAELHKFGRPVRVFAHHEAHAATAYYGSGWNDCLVVTADGWGEDASATVWHGRHGRLQRFSRSYTFDSLGYFYGSITKALGFVPHRHEGKVLGLAAFCTNPQSYPLIASMIAYDAAARRFVGLMEGGLYVPRFENPFLRECIQDYSREDVAAAAQRRLEEVVCACVSDFKGISQRLALAGGVFANVKLNQRLSELPTIDELFVFPNMGDGGLSVGAAWLAHVTETGARPEPFKTAYLGPETAEADIACALAASGLTYQHCPNIETRVAKLLAEGHVVARFDGRMEFGPRALGNRSILYQATDPSVNDWLNRRLSRSEFMPFAPATLEEHADDCYVGLSSGRESARYMTITFSSTPRMRAESPAAIHVDGTARPQLVSSTDHPQFHAILQAYKGYTGRSSIINTSFNMHEEPIVCTIDDALRAFRQSGLPYLAAGRFIVSGDQELLA